MHANAMTIPARFQRYELRTSDPAGARNFYAGVLVRGCEDVSLLPEPARRRGAPPHWLGHLGVPDRDAALAAFVARGATLLGPPPRSGAAAIVRDPCGAIVALAALAPADEPLRDDVGWHQLLTPELERSLDDHVALFGWSLGRRVHVPELGPSQPFAWAQAEVGSIAAIEQPGIHPQWLFSFRVPDIAKATRFVQTTGGLVVGPFELPDGSLMAVCEDPQGAAFGLVGPASRG
jgi:hypothetical protein